MSIKFKFVGFKELIAAMNLRVGKVRQAQGALRKVGEEEIKAAQYRLKVSKMTPDGQPWSPWAASTRRAREADGSAGLGLLHRNSGKGSLIDSFQLEINTNQVIVKNVAPYSTYLQEGTDNMPARPYFGWSKDSQKRIQTIFGDFLQKTVIEGKDYK